MAVLALCCAATVTDAQDRAAEEDGFVEGQRSALEGERQPPLSEEAVADKWLPLVEALRTAGRVEYPVFVYIRAPWCGPCYRLERYVFPHVEGELSSFIKARVDLSEKPDPGYSNRDFDWIRRHGVDVPPSFALLSPNGELVAAVTGFLDAPELRRLLQLGRDAAILEGRRERDDRQSRPRHAPAKDDRR